MVTNQYIPEYLTVAEVADILKTSKDTITRRFAKLPGVVNLGSEETRFKRQYRELRIPRGVLADFLNKNSVV